MEDGSHLDTLQDRDVDISRQWLAEKGDQLGLNLDPTQSKQDQSIANKVALPTRVSWNQISSDALDAWQGALIHPVNQLPDPFGQFNLRVEIVVRSITIPRDLLQSILDDRAWRG